MRHSPVRTAPASLLVVATLLFGCLGRAHASDSPDAASAAAHDDPARSQLEELAARVRQLEAERDARAIRVAAPAAPNPFVLGGYVEAFYAWNFRAPSNGVTNYRGFDNRHNTFTLSNVALDATWDHEGLVGKATLQVGHTPSTYYLGEPSAPGAGGANATGSELWKHVQQAYAGYRFGSARALAVTAGLFLSPIGPESMAVKDDWNWSRSNLFFGLPFYHTGLRASYALTERWAVTLAGYNGWNSVVDNNDEKSVSAQLAYTRADLAVSLLYFGGVERPRSASEGRAWRHLFDSHVTWHATARLSLLAHADAGFEQNRFGVSSWAAGALSSRLQLVEGLFLAVRGDLFAEHVARNGAGRAAPLFWPAPWVASGTATIDHRPHERVSFRLEVRHDQAGADMYFGGHVAGDGADAPFVANRASQDSVTLGVTTWF